MIDNKLIEFNQFVEICGDMYCVRETCEQCTYHNLCKNAEEEVFQDTILPIRQFVKTDNTSEPYKIEASSYDDCSYKQGRFKGHFIPNNATRIYKKITSINGVSYQNREIDFIVYHPDYRAFFCLKQRCSTCEFRHDCKFELLPLTYKDIILVCDIKAQEPNSFLLTTKMTKNVEKTWLKTFDNVFIRSSGYFKPLEILFKQNGIKTEAGENHKFSLWLDKSFFYDFTELYKLTLYINTYSVNRTDESKELLTLHCEKLLKSYEEFEV